MPFKTGNPSRQSVLQPRCRCGRAAARGLHGRAAQIRRFGGCAHHVVAKMVCRWAGRAGIRQARCRHRARDDGHQRGEGRRDRRRLRRACAEGHRARRRDDAEGFRRTTPAASSAASPPARTSLSSIAIKPTSSIRLPRRSIDKRGEPVTVETFGRHDPCVGIRATPIAEAMLAIVLMDHALRHRAQNADVRLPHQRAQ
jgi:hypothetical protein